MKSNKQTNLGSEQKSRSIYVHVRIHRGGGATGGPEPTENHKNLGFPSITGLDLLKITKLQSQHSMWAIIGTPAKRHFNGVSLEGRSLPAYGGFWRLSPLEKTNKKTNKKKNLSELGPL